MQTGVKFGVTDSTTRSAVLVGIRCRSYTPILKMRQRIIEDVIKPKVRILWRLSSSAGDDDALNIALQPTLAICYRSSHLDCLTTPFPPLLLLSDDSPCHALLLVVTIPASLFFSVLFLVDSKSLSYILSFAL